jgi:hypothetical protein
MLKATKTHGNTTREYLSIEHASWTFLLTLTFSVLVAEATDGCWAADDGGSLPVELLFGS